MYSDGKAKDRERGVVSIVGKMLRPFAECEDFGRSVG
jgi:hypothetical protein